MEQTLTDQQVDDRTILQVVVGSRAFGLAGGPAGRFGEVTPAPADAW
ncbi:hypothetical protein ACQPWW_19375 [Micromonospora sp. CA-240977]